MKVVIIGGVAGGASAAARLRRLDETAQIVMLERSGYISYANCGLPYYIGGKIKEQSKLTLQTPASFAARFNVEVRVKNEAVAIDRQAKKVLVKDLAANREYEESYDKLVLATGASPVQPDIPGIASGRIYTLRTVEDTLRLREAALQEGVNSAAVIGGGFVGLEMAENLSALGLKVTLIQKDSQVLPPLDADIASFIHNHLRAKGINLQLGQNVCGFAEKPDATGVEVLLANAPAISADLVVLAIGVAPESSLAQAAGLRLGAKNSVAVDDNMQTSDPDIYAVGDAVSITHSVSGAKSVIALAGPANKQGRAAADNIAGLNSRYTGSPGSAVLKVFDITAAFTGLNEKAAQAAGIDYDKIILAPPSHATYYPGSSLLTLKVLFAKDSEKIIGAQVVGFEGVDKRLDVLAVAMQAGLTVRQLKDLDLAYAPPYSSAKDPVNMAGFIAENILEGRLRQCFWQQAAELSQNDGVTRLDVRTDAEFAQGQALGFDKHIPLDELRQRLNELDKSKPVYVMCRTGLRSYVACRLLTQAGFECYNMAGGYWLYSSMYGEQDNPAHAECVRAGK